MARTGEGVAPPTGTSPGLPRGAPPGRRSRARGVDVTARADCRRVTGRSWMLEYLECRELLITGVALVKGRAEAREGAAALLRYGEKRSTEGVSIAGEPRVLADLPTRDPATLQAKVDRRGESGPARRVTAPPSAPPSRGPLGAPTARRSDGGRSGRGPARGAPRLARTWGEGPGRPDACPPLPGRRSCPRSRPASRSALYSGT